VNDAIVRLIVDFAHTLGLKVIAEGVENDRQVASLIGHEVRSGPGFLFLETALGTEAAGTLVATNPAWGVSKYEITIAAGSDLLPRGGGASVRRRPLSNPARNRVLEKHRVAATRPS
jgi:EAL domain-containing protein (putative c-di-GMP-specific phosphodiesterase class I)